MRRVRRAGERGQLLAVAALVLLAACLGAYVAARAGITLVDRARAQTAVDATALSAATAYARGLNVAAASNRLELAAFLVDILRNDPNFSLTTMVMGWQDRWLIAARGYMGAVAAGIAERNGLIAEIEWNDGSPVPDLLVRRLDLVMFFTGGPGGGADRDRPREKFSYQPRGGGPRVEVPAEQVEKVTYTAGGRSRLSYRQRTGPGQKGGRFLKREKVLSSPKGGGAPLPILMPTPLVEISSQHRVLVTGVLARPAAGPLGTYDDQRVPVRARAEAGRGEVFNAAFGDASFDSRLIPLPPPDAPAVRDSLRATKTPGQVEAEYAVRVAEKFRRHRRAAPE